MILYEEIYFEITMKGKKSELKKVEKLLKLGELDDFFEFNSEFINYGDDYHDISDDQDSEIYFTNDDMGIEIAELDAEQFLDVICKIGRNLELTGHVYDIDDNEYSFLSEQGDSDYINTKNISLFNDELDEAAAEEDLDD